MSISATSWSYCADPRRPQFARIASALESLARQQHPFESDFACLLPPYSTAFSPELAEFFPPRPGMHYDADSLKRRALRRIRKALLYTASKGNRPLSVLEIGCGRAENANYLTPFGHSYTGVDLDDSLFPSSQGKEQTTRACLTLVKADATDMPFPDNSFDLVISFNTFEHISDLNAAAQQIYRVMKPSGVFYTEFGPPFSYAFGPHLTRFSTFPHLHHIFSASSLALLTNRFDPYCTVNCEPISLYRNIAWFTRGLTCRYYREHLKGDFLWARKYFRGKFTSIPCSELSTARIDICLEKN